MKMDHHASVFVLLPFLLYEQLFFPLSFSVLRCYSPRIPRAETPLLRLHYSAFILLQIWPYLDFQGKEACD